MTPLGRIFFALFFALSTPTIAAAAPGQANLGEREELTPDQREVYDKVVNQALCPCSCPLTLGACLEQKPKCLRARIVSRYIAREARHGLTAMDIVTKVAEGFSSPPPLKFETKNAKVSQKGKAGAKIQVVEFADFRCHHCKETEPFMQELAAKMGDKVELTFKHFPLQGLEPSVLAAEACEAAGAQGKFWPYHDLLFKNQEQVGRDALLQYARDLKLDVKRFEKDLNDHTYRAKVMSDRDEGMNAKVDGTPAIFINGRPFVLERTLENFRDRADFELAPETGCAE